LVAKSRRSPTSADGCSDRRRVPQDDEEDKRIVQNIWGANYERLVAVKRRHDPHNIFGLNHHIVPYG
jgi:FAD/FMN-containing dehydrogenase